jgi:hypothetical protein
MSEEREKAKELANLGVLLASLDEQSYQNVLATADAMRTMPGSEPAQPEKPKRKKMQRKTRVRTAASASGELMDPADDDEGQD